MRWRSNKASKRVLSGMPQTTSDDRARVAWYGDRLRQAVATLREIDELAAAMLERVNDREGTPRPSVYDLRATVEEVRRLVAEALAREAKC
jgi:hypothetical protein